MNYNNYNITTARVNPYDKYSDEQFKEAEEKAEQILKQLVDTAETEGDCQDTALKMLENIQHIKFYGETGGVAICLQNAEDFSLYLIHGFTPSVIDFKNNHLRF